MDNKSSYTKQELLDIVKEQWFFKCHFRTTRSCLDAWGYAVLKVKDLQVDLLEKLVWGSGMDPALDSF